MGKRIPDKRRLGLALATAIAFFLAAVVEAASAVLHHTSGSRTVSAAGFAGVSLLWCVVYRSWKNAPA